jgi:hypothetical protein
MLFSSGWIFRALPGASRAYFWQGEYMKTAFACQGYSAVVVRIAAIEIMSNKKNSSSEEIHYFSTYHLWPSA